MSDDFTRNSLARIDAFIAQHPEYTRVGVDQPRQGATNRVVFGRRGDEPIVFKVFCEAERKQRECFAYRHWRETRLVPRLLADVEPDMIVTTRFPSGANLNWMRKTTDEAEWFKACSELGRAVASLMAVPMSAEAQKDFEARFYGEIGPLEAYLSRIVKLGRGVQSRDPGFRDDYWAESLDFVECQLPFIFAQPRSLYHQDPANHCFDGTRFTGFFDLEMCRVGGAAMQLSYCVGILGGSRKGWDHFCSGWEGVSGTALQAEDRKVIAAAVHLLGWRVITRYKSYDGTPGSGYTWAKPADPAHYRCVFDKTGEMLEVERGHENGRRGLS